MSSTTVPVSLGSLVLAQPLPGLATAPAGPTNGVLTVGEFASQSSEPAQAEQQFDSLAAKPGFGAFIRLWTDRGDAGAGSNDLAVLLFRISDVHTAQAFASGLNQPFEQASGSTRFAVPSVPGAQGYSVSVTTPVPAIERVVVFRAGRYVSMIELASTSAATNAAPLTPPQAVAISYLQLSQLRTGDPANSSEPTTTFPRPAPTAAAATPATPAGTSTTGPAAVVAAVAAAILVGLAAILWTRRRQTGRAPAVGPDLTIDPWGPAGVFAELAEVGLESEEPSMPGPLTPVDQGPGSGSRPRGSPPWGKGEPLRPGVPSLGDDAPLDDAPLWLPGATEGPPAPSSSTPVAVPSLASSDIGSSIS
jgi:hypothetical protein